MAVLGALGLSAMMTPAGLGESAGPPAGTRYYSTAEPPRAYVGPRPVLLAMNDMATAHPRVEGPLERPAPAPEPKRTEPLEPPAPPAHEVPRVASTAGPSTRTPSVPKASRPVPSPPPSLSQDPGTPTDPIALAKQAIAECQGRYRQVQDYVCTFYKRERIGGRLTPLHIMTMKARTTPNSLYFKFHQPNRGREAIYIAGRNGGRILAHDVGLGKVIAGTMRLDPRGSMAMEDNRHPITEAGLGVLIDTVAHRWATELTPEASRLTFHPDVKVGPHRCTMIESVHPERHRSFLFHKIKLYIDQQHGLPIRFEAYDWPRQPGAAPELVEEYTYLNLRTNTGLGDTDFDPANKQYSFGRF